MSETASLIQIPSPRIETIYSSKDEIVSLDLSPDGKHVASVIKEQEETCRVSVFASEKEVFRSCTDQLYTPIVFSGDGKLFFFADEEEKLTRILVPKFTYLDRIRIQASDRIHHLASSPDGKWLAYSDSSHKIGLFSFGDEGNFTINASYAGSRLCFSPDSQMIASFFPFVSKHIDLQELKIGAQTIRCEMSPLYLSSMMFSSDSNELFAVSSGGGLYPLWKKKDRTHSCEIVYLSPMIVNHLFAEPTGRLALAATDRGELIFVDLTKSSVIHRLFLPSKPSHSTKILFMPRDRSCQHLAVAVKYFGTTEDDVHTWGCLLGRLKRGCRVLRTNTVRFFYLKIKKTSGGFGDLSVVRPHARQGLVIFGAITHGCVFPYPRSPKGGRSFLCSQFYASCRSIAQRMPVNAPSFFANS